MKRGDLVTPIGRPGWHYTVRRAERKWACGRCTRTIRAGQLHASPGQGARPHYCLDCVEKIGG
jgi:hypothetical protein